MTSIKLLIIDDESDFRESIAAIYLGISRNALNKKNIRART